MFLHRTPTKQVWCCRFLLDWMLNSWSKCFQIDSFLGLSICFLYFLCFFICLMNAPIRNNINVRGTFHQPHQGFKLFYSSIIHDIWTLLFSPDLENFKKCIKLHFHRVSDSFCSPTKYSMERGLLKLFKLSD